ncbi:hypothetical protein CVD28_02820 [Bacillus sp. M6-12]|uniref:hypothetical protein n=1 Tax=Bacillus sp. M6-12 TaxID=2054166 RepID=UPI000C76E99D|nr:hypothetical protein [Bacillus sp. M6-12]PLS19365.1 hypothetical protein CVD28_02820 [Bacillus sp. M6-12]
MKKQAVLFLKLLTLFFFIGAFFSPMMATQAEAKMTKAQCQSQGKELEKTLWDNSSKATKMAKELAYKGQKKWTFKDYFNVMNYVKAFENKLLSIFKKGGDCAIYGSYNSNTDKIQWK